MKKGLLLGALILVSAVMSGCAVHYTSGRATVGRVTPDDLVALHVRRPG